MVAVVAAAGVIALWLLGHLSTPAASIFLVIMGIVAVAAVVLHRRAARASS